MIILGEVLAASGDKEVLAGNAPEKIQRMKTVLVLPRSEDSIKVKITNQLTYGTIDQLKDFLSWNNNES